MEQQQLRFEDLLRLMFDSVENKLKNRMKFLTGTFWDVQTRV
jgi:hypothetical protein